MHASVLGSAGREAVGVRLGDALECGGERRPCEDSSMKTDNGGDFDLESGYRG